MLLNHVTYDSAQKRILHLWAIFLMWILPLVAAEYGVQFLYVLFWGGAVLMTLYIVLYFGNEYVDQPRLVQVQAKDKNVWLETPPDSQSSWV